MQPGPRTAAEWITKLELTPHPEGGHFRRIWTAPATSGARASASAIYYLLSTASPVGHFHRNTSEILHVLVSGGPVVYSLLAPDGAWHEHALDRGDALHLICPGGWWKASALASGVDHALVAESVSPGFDYADHTMADVQLFTHLFPQHKRRWAGLVGPG